MRRRPRSAAGISSPDPLLAYLRRVDTNGISTMEAIYLRDCHGYTEEQLRRKPAAKVLALLVTRSVDDLRYRIVKLDRFLERRRPLPTRRGQMGQSEATHRRAELESELEAWEEFLPREFHREPARGEQRAAAIDKCRHEYRVRGLLGYGVPAGWNGVHLSLTRHQAELAWQWERLARERAELLRQQSGGGSG